MDLDKFLTGTTYNFLGFEETKIKNMFNCNLSYFTMCTWKNLQKNYGEVFRRTVIKKGSKITLTIKRVSFRVS